MIKRLSVMLAAVTFFAYAVPAAASAATGLTEGGALVSVKSKLSYTSAGHVTVTSAKLGSITCTSGTLTGEVKENSSTQVKVAGIVSTLTGCTAMGGTASVKDFTWTTEETTGGGSETMVFSFRVVLPSGAECSFSTTGGTATYNPSQTAEGSDLLSLTEVPLTATPAFCGTTGRLDAAFTRETDGISTPVYLM
jgi:hypothetical protein